MQIKLRNDALGTESQTRVSFANGRALLSKWQVIRLRAQLGGHGLRGNGPLGEHGPQQTTIHSIAVSELANGDVSLSITPLPA